MYVHFAEKLGGVNSDEDIPRLRHVHHRRSHDSHFKRTYGFCGWWDDKPHNMTDVILRADLVYGPEVVSALVTSLAAVLAHGSAACIASTVRNPETRALFLSKLDEASLQYEPCAGPREKVFFYDRSCSVAIDKITACSR
ncbi:hypothetical protein MRX96_016792 [Rhipicephalus microplus]